MWQGKAAGIILLLPAPSLPIITTITVNTRPEDAVHGVSLLRALRELCVLQDSQRHGLVNILHAVTGLKFQRIQLPPWGK